MSEFSVCHNPQKVYSKYLHDFIYVDCGKCPACLMRKRNKSITLLTKHAHLYKYTFFVTLTYREDVLPRLYCYQLTRYDSFDHWKASLTRSCRDFSPCYINDFKFVGPEQDICLYYFDIPIDGLSADLVESHYKGNSLFTPSDLKSTIIKLFPDYQESVPAGYFTPLQLPYLCHSDYQNFLKRLRFHSSLICDEKISYYVAGEYGPQHLRPHWHILLFFDSPQLAENIRSCVSKSWKFGRQDCSLSRDYAHVYTAAYLSSYTDIPKAYLCKCFRPFSRHSMYLGERDLPTDFQDAESCSKFFNEVHSQTLSQNIESYTPKSFESRILPRFVRNVCTTSGVFADFLSSFSKAFSRLSCCFVDIVPTCKDFAKMFCLYVRQRFKEKNISDSLLDFLRFFRLRLTNRHYVLSEFEFIYLDDDESFSKWVQSVYNIFHQVWNFFKAFRLSFIKPISYFKALSLFDSFQKLFNIQFEFSCKCFYEKIDKFHFGRSAELHSSYLDLIFNYKFSPLIKDSLFRSDCLDVSQSVKHKKLNDINLIFNY